MEENSTKTDADGTALFAGEAWFERTPAGSISDEAMRPAISRVALQPIHRNASAELLIGVEVVGTVDQVDDDGERSWAVTMIVLENELLVPGQRGNAQ